MNIYKPMVVFAFCLFNILTVAETAEPYKVSKNEHGQPDLQGVWSTRWHTMLERPTGMPLVLSPEMATAFAQAFYEG